MKKALLVIDMQNICVGEKHAAYFVYDNESLLQEVNKVIDVNTGNMVIYIKNVMKKNFINRFAPFQAYEGSVETELVEGLHIVSDNIYTKYKGDAFTNPALNDLLKEHNIECVEVIGVDGGACVVRTALGAIKAGYHVIINETAIGTMFVKNKEKFYKKLRKAGVQFVNENS